MTKVFADYDWPSTFHNGAVAGLEKLIARDVVRKKHMTLTKDGVLEIAETRREDAVQIAEKVDRNGKRWIVVTLTNRW